MNLPAAPPTAPAPTPVSRAVWQEVYDADPDAVVTQAPAFADALATRGHRDASRLYTLPDGRRLVLPLASRRGLAEESWPYSWGYGGAIVEGGELSVDDARLVLGDLRRRPVLLGSVTPMPLRGNVRSSTFTYSARIEG